MSTIRNWFNFGAVHRDNIREVRIQFSEIEGESDHNAMYEHKIGSKVVLGVMQSDKELTHFIDGVILGVRFSEQVKYDVAFPIGNTGVMSVMKNISGEHLRSPEKAYEVKPVETVKEVAKEIERATLSNVVQINPIPEAEPLAPVISGNFKWPTTYFGAQVTDTVPKGQSVYINSLKVAGAFEFEYCDFQIGDVVSINMASEDIPDAPPIAGYVYAINVIAEEFCFDIAVPTKDGYLAIYRDIEADYLSILNEMPEGK